MRNGSKGSIITKAENLTPVLPVLFRQEDLIKCHYVVMWTENESLGLETGYDSG